MRVIRRLAACVLAGLAAACASAIAGERGAPAGTFDYYVLSLSWSPSYCAAEGADANRQQCGTKRPFAFVVHGLWPQYEKGYPEYCANRQPERVPNGLVEANLDLMPSAGLIGHQWRKHGACSGLTQAAYFTLLRKARQRVAIPPELAHTDAPRMISPARVEEGFLKANPQMAADGLAVTCDRRYLREVRVCLTKALDFRPCLAVDRKACSRDRVLMPPSRGG